MYRQSEKNLLNSNTSSTCPDGELRPPNGWDLLASLGHPCKFQWVSRLGSVTAWQSSSGRQPNFAALNRGRHLYSAGRPSRWALAHILVFLVLFCDWFVEYIVCHLEGKFLKKIIRILCKKSYSSMKMFSWCIAWCYQMDWMTSMWTVILSVSFIQITRLLLVC